MHVGRHPSSLSALEERLGYRFTALDLLRRALTHRSWAAEHAGSRDNERLEYLGDAVLDLVVGALLFHRHPQASEGELTAWRAALVNTDHLARIAGDLGLGEVLLLGRGEAAAGGSRKSSLLGSAYEAVVGAVFLDGGFEAARQMVAAHFALWLERAPGLMAHDESKNRLQEALQARYGKPPEYVLVAESGPDHDKRFTMEVRFGDRSLGRGTGPSKKTAEKLAAAEALARLERGELQLTADQDGDAADAEQRSDRDAADTTYRPDGRPPATS